MPVVSPILRLSFGLILLTISILVVGDLLGLMPSHTRAELSARKSIAETLAIQLTQEVIEGRLDAVTSTLQAVHGRNPAVLSVGLRAASGKLIASAGSHSSHWTLGAGETPESTSQVRVPIHDQAGRWGSLEVSFALPDSSLGGMLENGSLLGLIAFLAVAGFGAYWLFLKRALSELDPNAVVPDRVRAALDVLAEGLVILDRSERIVLANEAFERKTGRAGGSLSGMHLSMLDWREGASGDVADPSKLPWSVFLDGGLIPETTPLRLHTQHDEVLHLAVNVASIKGQDEAVRGVVVTFDDVTQLERKNSDLERALGRLKQSQREITRQNRELQVLATRDPLTGVLNRRSLFEGLGTLLREAGEESAPLSCIMCDIDHFKSVNDRFGHATGDKVIKLLALILTDTVRAEDLVGRYGGEEFCVILPGVDEAGAADVAERMRLAVMEGKSGEHTVAVQITSSFGVATTDAGKLAGNELVDRADRALYVAKESGRNRVERWSEHEHTGEKEVAHAEAAPVAVSALDTDAARPAQELVLASPATPSPATDAERAVRNQVAELEAVVRDLQRAGATSDATGGIANRMVLLDRVMQSIERSRRFGGRLAVVTIGVDTVQLVDEARGHSAAEKLVKLAAGRLKATLRSTDTVAVQGALDIGVSVSRVGRGEFGAVLTDLQDLDSVAWVMQRVFAVMREPVNLEGDDIVMDVSVGVSVFPGDGDSADALLASSAAALREAKATAGRDVCLYYSPEMNKRAKEQMAMESHLLHAAERGELYLDFQPSVDLGLGRIVSTEALLRWRHPEWGLVSPDRFVPVAERTGAINEIGLWVLGAAARQLRLWHEAGHEHMTMAVNFSAVQLADAALVDKVVAALAREKLSPGALVVELTESALIRNLEAASRIIEAFNAVGVKVALDDFGTGYSSLSYLKGFPVDELKIDRTFLRDFPRNARDTSIVSAVIAMAHTLGLRVVAEGVETEEQLAILHDLQCDQVQGYLLSRPVPREQVTHMLNRPAEMRAMVRRAGNSKRRATYVEPSPVSGIVNEPPARRALH